jgi:hypothetical protein
MSRSVTMVLLLGVDLTALAAHFLANKVELVQLAHHRIARWLGPALQFSCQQP